MTNLCRTCGQIDHAGNCDLVEFYHFQRWATPYSRDVVEVPDPVPVVDPVEVPVVDPVVDVVPVADPVVDVAVVARPYKLPHGRPSREVMESVEYKQAKALLDEKRMKIKARATIRKMKSAQKIKAKHAAA